MFTFAGVLFLFIGAAALFRAGRALLAGRVWKDPRWAKFDRRWRPGCWVERGEPGGGFAVLVFYNLAVGAASVFFGLRWLLLQRP